MSDQRQYPLPSPVYDESVELQTRIATLETQLADQKAIVAADDAYLHGSLYQGPCPTSADKQAMRDTFESMHKARKAAKATDDATNKEATNET